MSRLADTELFAALTHEPAGDQVELQMFDLPEGRFAVACDLAERLADFAGAPIAHLAAPGRVLANALVSNAVGLLVNPGQPSQMLLDANMLAWLMQALRADARPVHVDGTCRLLPPDAEAVRVLADPLGQRMTDMAHLARAVDLARVEWADGQNAHLLIVHGAATGHQPAIAKALAELIAFLPRLEGGVDITFDAPARAEGALRIVAETPQTNAEIPQAKPSMPPRLR